MTTPQSVEEVENNIRSEIAGLAGMVNGSLIQDSGQAHVANMKLGKILEHIDSLTTLLSEREAEVRREERERIADLEATLGILEMSGRKTIKIDDVQFYLTLPTDNPTNV